jgi:hypothetical protein
MVPFICQGIPGRHLYFSTYRFDPPFSVSLSMLCAGKLLLPKSLFPDKKIIRIYLIIHYNFHFLLCLLHWMGKHAGITPAMAAEKNGWWRKSRGVAATSKWQ